MPGRLTHQSGDKSGAVHILVADITTIGRTEDNDVTVACDSVSSRHAEIRWDGRDYVLIDLASKNGTWLNRARLTGPHSLRPGDTITLPCQPPVHLAFD